MQELFENFVCLTHVVILSLFAELFILLASETYGVFFKVTPSAELAP